MNRIITRFLMLFIMLLYPFIRMIAAEFEGNYIADISVVTSAMGSSENTVNEGKNATIEKSSDALYNVSFSDVDVKIPMVGTSMTFSFIYKNLELKDGELVFTENSSFESKDKLTSKSFSAKMNGDNVVEGNFDISYSSGISVSGKCSFSMAKEGSDEADPELKNPTLKKAEFNGVQYYNTVNNVDMTKDTFQTVYLTVYKDDISILLPGYVAKLGDDKDLKLAQDVELKKLPYTINSDSTIIKVKSSTVMKIMYDKYNLDIPAEIDAVFYLSGDSLDGTLSYKVNEKAVPMLQLAMPGADFDVVCKFGESVKDVVVEVEKLDFNFSSAALYNATIPSGSAVDFKQIYYDEKNQQLLIYPISISNVSQQTALLMDAEVSEIVVDTIFNEVKYNFTNFTLFTSGIAKQFVKTGDDFLLVGEQEANLTGILSADNQFVGTAKIMGYTVKAKDAKKPVDAIVDFAPAVHSPLCGIKYNGDDYVAYIDSVDGVGYYNVSPIEYIDNDTVTVYPVKDKDGNILEVPYKRDIEMLDGLFLVDTVFVSYTVNDSLEVIDAREDVEANIRATIKANCDYKLVGLEKFSSVVAPGIYVGVGAGDIYVPVSVIVTVDKPNKIKDNAVAAKSISYSDGVLSLSGYTGEVSIYSILGSKVAAKKVSPKVALNLPTGVYLVKVGGTTEKIVVR